MSATLPITANDRTVTRTATTAGQVLFTTDFPVMAAEDLAVSVAPVGDPAAFMPLSFAGGAFAVTNLGNPAGASVTLSVGRAIGDVVKLEGSAALVRTQSIIRGGAFRSTAIDADLDRLMIVAQELRRDGAANASTILDMSVTLAGLIEALGVNPADLGMPSWRVHGALTALGVFDTIYQTIPGDPSLPLAIAWTAPLRRDRLLWTHIATTLDWDAADMASFLSVCLAQEL